MSMYVVLRLTDKKENGDVYRRVPVCIMAAQHEPMQLYLIESKMEELDYSEM